MKIDKGKIEVNVGDKFILRSGVTGVVVGCDEENKQVHIRYDEPFNTVYADGLTKTYDADEIRSCQLYKIGNTVLGNIISEDEIRETALLSTALRTQLLNLTERMGKD